MSKIAIGEIKVLQGPQGVQGIRGEQGVQGVRGLQGDPGPQGVQGEVGPAGPNTIPTIEAVATAVTTPVVKANLATSFIAANMPQAYGAKGDLRRAQGGSIASGSKDFSAAGVTFDPAADVGKMLDVYGAGGPVTPPAVTLYTSSTGGSLQGGQTYRYATTVVTAAGESIPGPDVSINVPAGTNTNTVEVRFRNPTAGGYGPDAKVRIYGRSTSRGLLAERLAQPHFTDDWYIDTGSDTPGTAAPTVDASRGTLSAKIASVSGGVATLTVAASATVSAAAWQYGTDDAAAIQACANAVGPYGEVRFPEGSYLIGAILRPPAGQKWIGTGRKKTILRMREPGQGVGTPSRIVYLQNQADNEFIGIGFDGARDTAPRFAGALIQADRCSNVRIGGCGFWDLNSSSYAVRFYKSSDCGVHDSSFRRVGYSIVINDDVASTAKNARNRIIGCDFEDADYNHIFLSGGFNLALNPTGAMALIEDTVISDCRLRGFWDTAIEYGQGSARSLTSDITIDGMGYGRNGLLFRDCVDTYVSNATIGKVGTTSAGHGVQLLRIADGAKQVNTSFKNVIVSECGYGIAGRAGTTQLIMDGVATHHNTLHGVWLREVIGFALAAVTSYANGRGGFVFGAERTPAGAYLSTASHFAQGGTVLGCAAFDNGKEGGGTFVGFSYAGADTTRITTDACLSYNTGTGADRTQSIGFDYSTSGAASDLLFGPSNVGWNLTNGGAFNGSKFDGIIASGRLHPRPVGEQSSILNKRTSNYTLAATDGTVLMDGGNITATLPTGSSVVRVGRIFVVKNINSTPLTVSAETGTIDGAATVTLAQGVAASFQFDGTLWWRI